MEDEFSSLENYNQNCINILILKRKLSICTIIVLTLYLKHYFLKWSDFWLMCSTWSYINNDINYFFWNKQNIKFFISYHVQTQKRHVNLPQNLRVIIHKTPNIQSFGVVSCSNNLPCCQNSYFDYLTCFWKSHVVVIYLSPEIPV